MEMTKAEFKQFEKIQHKRKVTEDAQELGVPGLDKTIFMLERKITKLEKQLKTIEIQSQKAYALAFLCDRVNVAIQKSYKEKHGEELIT